MNTIHLQDYARHGMIATNIEHANLADAVLFEAMPSDEIIGQLTIPVYDFPTLTWWRALAGSIVWLANIHKRLVVVLDSLGIQDIVGLFQAVTDTPSLFEKLIVINSSSWISGLKTKWYAEQYDISILSDLHVQIIDPADVVSFFRHLTLPGCSYVRLQSGQYPRALYEWYEGTPVAWHVVSLKDQWVSGHHGTVLSLWRATTELINVLISLQEVEKSYDCFVAQHYNWSITDALRDSLLQTERLIIVADSHAQPLKQYARAALFEAWLYEVEIGIICPEIASLTWMHDEYMYDQAGFSNGAFVEILK